MSNILTAQFDCGRSVIVSGLWQYDYGQILQFALDLPTTYEVHFANDGSQNTMTVLGDADGVMIPDELLQTGKAVYAWVYLHTGADDGETEYVVRMPVNRRPQPTNTQPTPVQQDIITQAIAALNSAVTETSEYALSASESAASAAEDKETTEGYKTEAQQAAETASGAALAAATSAQNADASEEGARGYAQSAEASAASADASADRAETAADRAEQQAGQSGYMFFYIDGNGDLIYQRTSNTQVDFYLEDGDLYVEANL